MFGSSSDLSLPPLIGAGGGLVCESVGKADMLSAHFDGKQYRDLIDLLSTCHLSPSLTTFAFRSWEEKQLLLDLDSYGGTDPLGMFPLFLKNTAEVLAPRLAVVFWWLLCLGSLPVCWRVANVIPIPKVPPFCSASNYRPISLTPILSKVFEHLVLVRICLFMECRSVLPTTQFAYRKVLALVMPIFFWHTPYRVLWRWGRRLELFRSTSVPLLTGSTIRGFSSSSVLWELEVQCCLF